MIMWPFLFFRSRMCVSECPSGFFRDDRKRCKKCSSMCETCVGSRSDQCITCRTGYHLIEGSNTCAANCADGSFLDIGMSSFFFFWQWRFFFKYSEVPLETPQLIVPISSASAHLCVKCSAKMLLCLLIKVLRLLKT